LKLREWQEKAFPLWWAKKRGIIKVVTGGGKTFFAIHCLKKYLEDDPIEVKIRKMKQEGKLYSLESLYQLMQVVNSRNIIYIDKSFSGISRYHMLEETIQTLEKEPDTGISVEIRESLKTLMDTFDITIETRTKEMVTIDRLINKEWAVLEKKVLKLKKTSDRKQKKIIEKFISSENPQLKCV